MRSQLLAVSAAILFLGAVVPAASDETATTTITATAFDNTSKNIDYTCVVQSGGEMLGSFVTTQAGLTIPHRLPEMSMTCTKTGYSTVVMRMQKGADESLPAVIAPRFMVKAG